MNDKGLCSGDVVIYADRQGHHIALALKVNDKSHIFYL